MSDSVVRTALGLSIGVAFALPAAQAQSPYNGPYRGYGGIYEDDGDGDRRGTAAGAPRGVAQPRPASSRYCSGHQCASAPHRIYDGERGGAGPDSDMRWQDATPNAPAAAPRYGRPERPQAYNGGGAAGVWHGTYFCYQGETGVRLNLRSTGGDNVEGEFNFFAIETNPTVPTGSYGVRGQLSWATGQLVLTPTNWIQRPPGYFMVGVDARLSRGTVEGKAVGRHCSTIRMSR